MHVFGLPSPVPFVLATDDSVLPLAEPWIPRSATRLDDDEADADIRVRRTDARPALASRVEGPRLLQLGAVRAFRLVDGNIELEGASAARGFLDFAARRGVIDVAPEATAAADDVYCMLTIAAAMLLGLNGMALVHAGAVVDREGGAWLVVGDSHSGKTSTCTALCDAGWSYLADDQVVLALGFGESVTVTGWPRRAHLDVGWSERVVRGEREAVDLVDRWAQPSVGSAPLAGVLLPRVRADEPTHARVVSPADVLTELIRQSPWLVADAIVAGRTLPLLERASRRQALALSLGVDSYTRGDVIEARFLEAL
ncbi:MAG: hypothetical protein JWM95_3274 [Gemmatimonadetes bacterium]|nr:hypothetical protein [Gemmatimonadota bacterium]